MKHILHWSASAVVSAMAWPILLHYGVWWWMLGLAGGGFVICASWYEGRFCK
jgi:hypothetical protein